jgi:hypothetical protein
MCRTVRRFRDKQFQEMAASVKAEFQDAFKPHGATLVVRPQRISHLTSVGEGVQLGLSPFDVKAWDYWGDFESDLEVSRRPRGSKAWTTTVPLDDVRAWLRAEAQDYLRQLAD